MRLIDAILIVKRTEGIALLADVARKRVSVE